MDQDQELRGIVQRMVDAGESEDNIAAVIQRFSSSAPSSQLETRSEPVQHPHARVASGALKAIQGMARAVAHPMDSARAVLYDAPAAMFDKSRTAETLPERLAYGVAGAIPLVGPMAAHVGEEIAAGRVPELIGEAAVSALVPSGARAGLAAAKGAPKALSAAGGRAASAVGESVRTLADNPTAAILGAVEGYQIGGVPGAIAGGVGIPVGLRGAARMLRERVKTKTPGKAAEAIKTKSAKPKAEASELLDMAAEARTLSKRLVLSPEETARLAFLMERLKTSAKESGMSYAGAQPKRKG